jgi:hypothetical protein
MHEEKPPNRRRSSDEAIESLRRDMNEYRIESRHDRMQIKQQITCLAAGFKAFKEDWDNTYKPHLDADIKTDNDRREFIREKIKAWRSRAFDVVVGAIFVVFGWGLLFGDWLTKAKAHVKSLF